MDRRQTRRRRRTRRRRAELKDFASALPHELVTAGCAFCGDVWGRRGDLRESARAVSKRSDGLVRALGSGVVRSARFFTLSLSSAVHRVRRNQVALWRVMSAVLNELIVLVHRLTGDVEWEVLFFGLLFSLGGMVVCAIAGADVFAVLFFLLSLFLYLALWKRES